jgi:hypothetical protein
MIWQTDITEVSETINYSEKVKLEIKHLYLRRLVTETINDLEPFQHEALPISANDLKNIINDAITKLNDSLLKTQ